jgi:acetyl-CoA acetyltransferase family protein
MYEKGMFKNAFIPYKGYYTTPFVKWQGSLASAHPVKLGGATCKRWLAERRPEWDPMEIDYVNFGQTVAMKHAFWNGSWVAALLGAERTVGVWISQACSTFTTMVFDAAMKCEVGAAEWVLNVGADRMSNGPHSVWPNPMGPGGYVEREDWVMDNFSFDPWAQEPMVDTADMVAKEAGITKEECDEAAWVRYQQYQKALANDREFQKRYMFPVEVQLSKKKVLLVEADEGITATSQEVINAMKPLNDWGVHSFAAQTHPADANAALTVCSREKAKELAEPDGPEIQIVSFGYARAEKARMGKAPVPATEMALAKAGLTARDIKAWKSHSPFAVNDLNMARHFDADPYDHFNDYGCSMIYGHPQSPTMARHIIELIEQLAMEGGGFGCATGCAAGDTGATLIFRVG